jgi:hypothetical protein
MGRAIINGKLIRDPPERSGQLLGNLQKFAGRQRFFAIDGAPNGVSPDLIVPLSGTARIKIF